MQINYKMLSAPKEKSLVDYYLLGKSREISRKYEDSIKSLVAEGNFGEGAINIVPLDSGEVVQFESRPGWKFPEGFEPESCSLFERNKSA